MIKRFPFDPLDDLHLPAGGFSRVQGGYLQTPLIRPIATSQNKNDDQEKTNSKPSSEKK